MTWPSSDDLLVASNAGHIPNRRDLKCSCGWVANYRSGVAPWVQLSNHVWTVIHVAKQERAERMGDEICIFCKGTGTSNLFLAPCQECIGSGIKKLPEHGPDERSNSKLRRIAVHLGHEPLVDWSCTCGSPLMDQSSWRDHAAEVATKALKDLEEFEEGLRHG